MPLLFVTAVAVPVALTQTLVPEFSVSVNEDGCVIVFEEVAVQRLASVTVTTYVPAESPVLFCVVMALPQLKPYAPVPPVTVNVIAPLFPALQLTLVSVVEILIAEGCVIVVVAIAEQLLLSVTVTV